MIVFSTDLLPVSRKQRLFMDNDKLAKDENNSENGLLDEILEWIESFVFAIFVVILVFIFLFRIVLVSGPSMNPTLSDGDRLIISHINYTPERGDIVVLNSIGLNKTIIKRCIGTAGDIVRVDYNNNSVSVNGENVPQDYINEVMNVLPIFDAKYCVDSGVYEYAVPDGKIFVMGDNRNHSTDSRSAYVGFVDLEDVLGKAIFRIIPFDSFGKIG